MDWFSMASSRSLPPRILTDFARVMALLRTSASWSLAARRAKSTTERGTACSLTPYFSTMYSMSCSLVFLILGVALREQDLVMAEQQMGTPKSELSMILRRVFSAWLRILRLLSLSLPSVALKTCSSSLCRSWRKSDWLRSPASRSIIYREALAVWQLWDFTDSEQMNRQQRYLFLDSSVASLLARTSSSTWLIASRRSCQKREYSLRMKVGSQNSRRCEELAQSAGLSFSASAGTCPPLSSKNSLSPIQLDQASCVCPIPLMRLITAGSILSSQLTILSFLSIWPSSSSLSPSLTTSFSSFRMSCWMREVEGETMDLPSPISWSFCLRGESVLKFLSILFWESQQWLSRSVIFSLQAVISSLTRLAPRKSSSWMHLRLVPSISVSRTLPSSISCSICFTCLACSKSSRLMKLALSWFSRFSCGSSENIPEELPIGLAGTTCSSRGVPVKVSRERPTWLKKLLTLAWLRSSSRRTSMALTSMLFSSLTSTAD